MRYGSENGHSGISSITSGVLKVEIFPVVISTVGTNLGRVGLNHKDQITEDEPKQTNLFSPDSIELDAQTVKEILLKLDKNSLAIETIVTALETQPNIPRAGKKKKTRKKTLSKKKTSKK